MADQGTPRPTPEAGVEAFTFRLWGRFSARRLADGADVTPRGRKARTLLAILLVEGGAVGRERLAGLLWSERGQAQALASLRQCLFELREFAPLIAADRDRVALVPGLAVTDVEAAAAACALCDPDGVIAAIPSGTALLEDLDGTDPAFDQWLRSERAERGEMLIDIALQCGRDALANDRVDAAERLARRLHAIDPLDERPVRLAMEAAYRAGKQDAVRRIYEDLATRLHKELSVAPSEETRALHDRLTRPTGTTRDQSSADEGEPLAAQREVVPHRRAWRRWWTLATLALLLVVASAFVALRIREQRAVAEPTSLAVLPFRNLSGGEDYFAEGVAEEILTQLARQPALRVAGRTSSWMFRDSADLRDVGRRLDVAYVLEGSVRRDRDRVRVDVALVDTRDGMRRWSEGFQGSLNDIFAIQSRVGSAVAGAMGREMTASAAPTGPLTTRGDVYTLYLTARGLVRERTPAKLETAVTLLRQAVQLDPNYAPALARLGVAMHMSCVYADCDQLAQIDAEALQHVNRAITLAPNLAEAHAAMALVRDFDRPSLAHLIRANRLDPRDPEIWYWLYIARGAELDYEGALDAARRAATLDPFFRFSFWYAHLAFNMGEPDQAMRYWRMIATRHPNAHQRSNARFSIAFYRNDLSEAYRHAHEGTAVASRDEAYYSRQREAAVLIRLGFIEEARRRDDFPPPFLAMLRGEIPTVDTIARIPVPFWDLDEVRLMAPRLLLNAGRGRDLVALYDRAFRSPEDMAARHPRGREAFIGDAANVAIALRDVGRRAEADRILAIAGRWIEQVIRRGRVPARFKANAAAIWAAQGQHARALAALDQVIRAGWRWQSTSAFPPLSEQPAFRTLRDDSRIRRWDAMMRAEIARERRETLPLLDRQT